MFAAPIFSSINPAAATRTNAWKAEMNAVPRFFPMYCEIFLEIALRFNIVITFVWVVMFGLSVLIDGDVSKSSGYRRTRGKCRCKPAGPGDPPNSENVSVTRNQV